MTREVRFPPDPLLSGRLQSYKRLLSDKPANKESTLRKFLTGKSKNLLFTLRHPGIAPAAVEACAWKQQPNAHRLNIRPQGGLLHVPLTGIRR